MLAALVYAAIDVVFLVVSKKISVVIYVFIYIIIELLGIYISFGKIKL